MSNYCSQKKKGLKQRLRLTQERRMTLAPRSRCWTKTNRTHTRWRKLSTAILDVQGHSRLLDSMATASKTTQSSPPLILPIISERHTGEEYENIAKFIGLRNQKLLSKKNSHQNQRQPKWTLKSMPLLQPYVSHPDYDASLNHPHKQIAPCPWR